MPEQQIQEMSKATIHRIQSIKRLFSFFFSAFLCLAAAGSISTASAADNTATFHSFKSATVQRALPATARRIQDFVPKGWRLEDTVSGDLNGDGLADCVLKVSLMSGYDDLDRALIVLFRQADKSFRRFAASNSLSPTSDECGPLGSAAGEHVLVEIKKGVLKVGSMTGSRDAENSSLKFRFNAKTRRLELIGADTLFFDRATGEQKLYSANLITGRRVIERSKIDEAGTHAVGQSRSFKGPQVKVDFAGRKCIRLTDKEFGCPIIYDLN